MADDTRVTPSRWALACSVALFWALGCVLPGLANAAELIVKRDAGLSAGQRADIREDAGVRFEHTSALPRSELVTVPDAHAAQALATLNAHPDVVYAAPNAQVHLDSGAAPTDPWWYAQWSLESANDADIDALTAWNHGRGAGVKVGVVDQQIYTDHPDLVGRI